MFASGPLHVTTQAFFLPHMGLIEGLAVSVEGSSRRLTPHQWAAALLALDKLPHLPTIMGTEGYLNTYGPTAYTAAGSFVAYLTDTYSMERVLSVYQSADFQDAFGKDLPALIGEWKGFLQDREKVPLGEDELARAEHLFDQKPVLKRICPLVVAQLTAEANAHVAKEEYDEAFALYEQVLSFRDNAPRQRAQFLDALMRAGELERAQETATAILNDSRTGGMLSARISEKKADIAWKEGKWEQASRDYGRLLSSPLSVGEIRRIALKKEWVNWPDAEARETGRKVLFAEKSEDPDTSMLERLSEVRPDDPTVLYLLGRQDLFKGEYSQAHEHLQAALQEENFHPLVRAEAHRSAGISAYFIGKHTEAKSHFQEADKDLPQEAHGLREQLQDWVERCDWKMPRKEVAGTSLFNGPLLEESLELDEDAPVRTCFQRKPIHRSLCDDVRKRKGGESQL